MVKSEFTVYTNMRMIYFHSLVVNNYSKKHFTAAILPTMPISRRVFQLRNTMKLLQHLEFINNREEQKEVISELMKKTKVEGEDS